MKNHQHGAPTPRWTLSALLVAIAIATVAGCTAAQPTANGVAPATSSRSTAPAQGNDTTSSTARAVSSSEASTAESSASLTRTTASASSARTGSSASRTTPPRTTAPAGQASTTAAPAAPRRTQTADPATTRSSATTSPRPRTTAVAPPVQGNIHQTVPAETPVTLAAAPLTAQARPDKGVAVEVTDIHAVNTVAAFPGEIAGPGVAVTIHVVNSSSAAIDLDNAIVDLRGSNGERGIAVSGSPAAPMSGSLLPGQQTSGVYVFTIPPDQRNPISIRFSYAAETPTVLFVGDAQ